MEELEGIGIEAVKMTSYPEYLEISCTRGQGSCHWVCSLEAFMYLPEIVKKVREHNENCLPYRQANAIR